MTVLAHATRTRARRSRSLLRDGLTAASVAALAFIWLLLGRGDFFHDAYAYWSIDYGDMYGSSLVGRPSTYLYSPAFAHLIFPLTRLPWEVFAAAFCAVNLLALAWMVGPVWAAVLLLLPFSPVRDEITTGNIHLLIGAACLIGFRASSAWALPLLTKVTPGVGALWFVGRRAWRSVLVAGGVSAGLAACSFVLAPEAWIEWVSILTRSAGVAVPSDIGVIPGPLWLRTILAAGFVLLGGWMGWRWTVPVAAVVALPVTWSSGLAILVVLIPLYRAHLGRAGSQLSGQLRRYSTSFASR